MSFINEPPEVSIFESVQAVVKRGLYQVIKKFINSSFVLSMKQHGEHFEICELQDGHALFIGSMKAILYSQKLLIILMKRPKEISERNGKNTVKNLLTSDGQNSVVKYINFLSSETENTTIDNTDTSIKMEDIWNHETDLNHCDDASDACGVITNCDDAKIVCYSETVKPLKEKAKKRPGSVDNNNMNITFKETDLVSGLNDTVGNTIHSNTSLKAEFDETDTNIQASLTESLTDSFKCRICTFSTTKKTIYEKHLSYHKLNAKVFSCSLCDFRSFTNAAWNRHMEQHQQSNISESLLKPKERTCKICDDTFTVYPLYKQHISQHKLNGETRKYYFPAKYTCKVCGFETHLKKEYKQHLEKEHPTTYSCNQCIYKTETKFHYIRHVKNVHENVRPYKCSVCDVGFKRSDSLKQHQVVHLKEGKPSGDANGGALFKCKVCKKIVRSAAYLKEHMLTHSDERSILCEICGAGFKTKFVYWRHLKVVHAQSLRVTCKFCSKHFVTKFSLKRHMRQHEKTDKWKDLTVEENSPTDSCSVTDELRNSLPQPIDAVLATATPIVATVVEKGVTQRETIASGSIYTDGASSAANFDLGIDNQIPYVIHSTHDVTND